MCQGLHLLMSTVSTQKQTTCVCGAEDLKHNNNHASMLQNLLLKYLQEVWL